MRASWIISNARISWITGLSIQIYVEVPQQDEVVELPDTMKWMRSVLEDPIKRIVKQIVLKESPMIVVSHSAIWKSCISRQRASAMHNCTSCRRTFCRITFCRTHKRLSSRTLSATTFILYLNLKLDVLSTFPLESSFSLLNNERREKISISVNDVTVIK